MNEILFKSNVSVQACISLVVTLIAFGIYGTNAGISSIMGCIVAVLPCWLFFYLVFFKGGSTAKKLVKQFYIAELFKFVLLIGLFALAMQYTYINVLIFFISFFILQVTYWVQCLMHLRGLSSK